MSIDVSVIVPVYNTNKYLEECIQSIATQTIFDRMEIILVDDGSTDSSSKLCDSFALTYENITVIHQKNAGVSAARNAGISKAVGRYIGFVDSDDYIFPEMMERLLENAEKTNADMSVCRFVHSLPDADINITYPFPENKALSRDFVRGTIYEFLLRYESFNSCCNKLFKTLAIKDSKLLFIDGRKIGEDRRFTIDFLSNCGEVCYTSYSGYYYRPVATSAIQTPRTNYMDTIINQHYEDFTLFETLGVDRKTIEENSGHKLVEQALTAVHLSENKLKGKTRQTAIKAILENKEMRRFVFENWNSLKAGRSRYEKLLILMIKTKSALGVRAVMLAMKAKNKLVRSKAQ